MPRSRLGCYAGREKEAHGDPSIDSFGQAVARYVSLGKAIEAAHNQGLEAFTVDEIIFWRKECERYRKMGRDLERKRLFVLWCKEGESLKEFEARWAVEQA